jgi:hypothetical protein
VQFLVTGLHQQLQTIFHQAFVAIVNQPWLQVANYTNLYVLASLEPTRASAQIIHEQDPCCFHGCGRHDRIRAYNSFVSSQAKGAFRTIATVGNKHEVNVRDKVVVATLLERLRTAGVVTKSDLLALPFNTLDEW